MKHRSFWARLRSAVAIATFAGSALVAATIEDVLKQIDPATGKAADTATTHALTGVVSARATLADGSVLAYIHPVGGPGLAILAGKAESASIVPRYEIKVAGALADGPLGFAVLKVKEGSVAISMTNKSVGVAEPRGAAFFKDASSLANRYVQLTNVTFAAGKFDASGKAVVSSPEGNVTLQVPATIDGREFPAGPLNVFGVPARIDGEWRLVAARFLSVNNKAVMSLAAKHTCMTCHNPDMKMVGPAYRDVAAKYRNDPAARAALITQIEKGGNGKWGLVPMPALGTKVPPADRETLVDWVLGYRWDAILAE